MMTDTAFRLKIGNIEIECEGASSFIKEELVGLMENITALFEAHRDTLSVDTLKALSEEPDQGGKAYRSAMFQAAS